MLRQCCVNNVEHLTIRDTIGIKLYPSCMFGFFLLDTDCVGHSLCVMTNSAVHMSCSIVFF